MTLVIIQHTQTGEVQAVSDTDGYDEAEWLVLGIDRAPLPNESWDGTAWVLDEARAAEQDELAEITDRQRLRQIIRNLRQRIRSIEDRLDALEGN